MSRNTPDQYRAHRARRMFDETIGLLRLEIALSERGDSHCPRRTINAHVRMLQYLIEDMPATEERADLERQLAEQQRRIAQRDCAARRAQMRMVINSTTRGVS